MKVYIGGKNMKNEIPKPTKKDYTGVWVVGVVIVILIIIIWLLKIGFAN